MINEQAFSTGCIEAGGSLQGEILLLSTKMVELPPDQKRSFAMDIGLEGCLKVSWHSEPLVERLVGLRVD